MIFYYKWPDSTVSFVDANSKEDAQSILDEIGDISNIQAKKGIKKFDTGKYRNSFHVTFGQNPESIFAKKKPSEVTEAESDLDAEKEIPRFIPDTQLTIEGFSQNAYSLLENLFQ